LLTKVGIYALLRILGMLFPVEREELSLIIAIVAALTMVLGVMGALAQNDIRRAMGFLVISGIGVMMAGLALGSPAGLSGAIFYAAHSMVVMTALYFAIGIGAQLGGSFMLSSAGGLYARSAVLAFLTLMLFLSVSGLPPFSGFWPKVVLVKASLDVGAWWLAGSILVTGLLTTITVGRIWALAYWRPAKCRFALEQAAAQSLPAGAMAALAGLVVLSSARASGPSRCWCWPRMRRADCLIHRPTCCRCSPGRCRNEPVSGQCAAGAGVDGGQRIVLVPQFRLRLRAGDLRAFADPRAGRLGRLFFPLLAGDFACSCCSSMNWCCRHGGWR
jgi:NADH:ubiquinone oxidoreductase subunit 5 (subunit L)/multisubunit Na+/H+ antiporter MnhA subunit